MAKIVRLTVQISTGFSLVELLVALIVFSIIAVGVLHSTVTTFQTNRDSQQQAVAVNLAHQVLECVKSQIRAGRNIDIGNAGQDCNPAGAPAGYTLAGVTVTPNPSGFDGLTRIQLTISWRSPLPDSIAFDWLVDT
jgi:prepilin-type N-terminal cleavage/methylation domain-containing protein